MNWLPSLSARRTSGPILRQALFGRFVSWMSRKISVGFEDPIDFHRQQSQLAHALGLMYLASLNANTNAIDNLTFFRTYREMCAIETVDFATSWQWPRGHHPLPSFEERWGDPSPAVQAAIAQIPAVYARGRCARERGLATWSEENGAETNHGGPFLNGDAVGCAHPHGQRLHRDIGNAFLGDRHKQLPRFAEEWT